MANRKKGEVDFTVGELELVLRFPTKSMMLYEQASGMSFDRILSRLQEGQAGMSIILPGIAAGISHMKEWKGQKVDHIVDRVGDLLDSQFDSLPDIITHCLPPLLDAVLLSLGVDQESLQAEMQEKMEADSGNVEASQEATKEVGESTGENS